MKSRLTIRSRQTDESDSQSQTSDNPDSSAMRFDIDLAVLARLVISRRRWITAITGTVVLATAVLMFTTPNRYISRATILPSGSTANLTGLKAMVGLAGGLSTTEENSSALYPVILASSLVKDTILSKSYTFRTKGTDTTLTLKQYFGRDDPDKLRRSLSGITQIDASQRTGEIRVGVETIYPEFSRAVLKEYLIQLENFNFFRRRSSARENEKHLALRLGEIKMELERAENRLEAFQMANRDWPGSTNPEIMTELTRLKRDVVITSSTFSLLHQQYELARLSAQRDIPIVRILDQPSLPTVKSGPKRIVTIFLSGVISTSLVVFAIIVADFIGQGLRRGRRSSNGALIKDLKTAFPESTKIVTRLREKVRERTATADTT